MVFATGTTGKFTPLALEPKLVPSTLTLYHLIVLPEEIAVRFELLPKQKLAGDANTEVGNGGRGLTKIVTCLVVIMSASPALVTEQLTV